MVRRTLSLDGLGPDLVLANYMHEYAAIRRPLFLGTFSPTPLQPEYVIAVILVRHDVAIYASVTIDHAVLHSPKLVEVHALCLLILRIQELAPTGQVPAIEQLDPPAILCERALPRSDDAERDEAKQ